MTRDSGQPPQPSLLTTAAEPLPSYKLGEKLGQGSFGSVYRALNWTTGETVAVKQIGLANIPKSELPDIMSEIDLLKNLHHSNIVQYRGFVKTSDFLYIILEYCENGSLHNITKKFGRFPESLVGLYTLQVLQGLMYLHDQGVIHRDIKGSNILATKEGSIKLADFGVAVRTYEGGPRDSAVVGSPYWMAPEVVDQSGATTASDIWSLGALVIELLTGKPPYHFLDPMPALFRIVNDDCPPIPEGASAVVRDFLLQCFQKDGNLRISARKLLRHPWMMAAKRQVEATKRDQQLQATGTGLRPESATTRGGGAGQPRPMSMYDDSVQRVQEWNERIKAEPTNHAAHRLLRRPSAELASALHAAPTPQIDASPVLKKVPLPQSLLPPAATQKPRVTERSQEGEEQDDNWDDDFDEGISISKIAALDREPSSGASSDSDEGSDDDGGTIRPSGRNSPAVNPAPMAPIVEDYSDLLGDDEAEFEGKVASLQEYNASQKRILHPKDLSESFNVPPTPSSSSSISKGRSVSGSVKNLSLKSGSSTQRPPRPPLAPLALGDNTRPSTGPSSASAFTASSRTSSTVSLIDKYSETGESEDYDDLFGAKSVGPRSKALQLTTRLSSKSWLGDEDSDEDDPFASVESPSSSSPSPFSDDATDLDTNLYRDALARLSLTTSSLLDVISASSSPGATSDEFALREAAIELIGLLEDNEPVKDFFLKAHGMLVVVETLQVVRARDVLGVLLRVVNLIVGSDGEALEKLCLVGGCPIVMGFASAKYSREIRLEAALFIGAMCRTSLLTLQMFVSCRGLKTLVEMMDENYAERKDLVWMAVDGISRVFEMHGPTPRNDFCRIFNHEGLLEPLSSALLSVSKDDDDLAESAKAKIINIFLLFAQSDRKVKEAMANRVVVLRLVKALSMLQPELLAVLLKTIKNLTMLPTALDVLQNANTIEVLVGILAAEFEGKLAAEIQNHVVNALFNLCRLSKIRQEEAAVAGAIPILQRVVQGSSPLKQFALPILCDFAHASKTCRRLLWKHDGLHFYLTLLKDSFWANPALDAILSWLTDEPARVEDCLVEPAALEALLRVFCKTKSTTFETLLEPFHKILRVSPSVSSRLATHAAFFKRIIDRLSRTTNAGKAIVRLNLLRITKTVYDNLASSPRDREKVVKILAEPVARLAAKDPSLLVQSLAKELEGEFGKMLKEGKRAMVKRVLRRSGSEGSVSSHGRSGSATQLLLGAVGPRTGDEIGGAATPSRERRQGNMFGRVA